MAEKHSNPKKDIIGIFSILITISVAIITLYFTAVNPEIGILFLSLIYFFIVVYFIADFIIASAKKKIDQINKNSENINSIRKEMDELKKNLNLHFEIAKIKAKVESMGNPSKTKRGSIDPRIVIVIFILIIFYLYLRTLGVFP